MTPQNLAYLRVPRKWALYIISLIVTLSTAVSLIESYRALYIWAINHQVFGNFAYIWPLMIDSFIVVGELTLFVAMTDLWKGRARIFPWVVTLSGLAVSVAGNVGHVHTHNIWTRLTAAVAPIAASASLTVGMGVLKRVVRLHHSTALDQDSQDTPSAPETPVEALTARGVPSLSTYSTATAEPVTDAPSDPEPVELKPVQQVGPRPGGHAKPRQTRSWSRERRVNNIVARNPEITGAELGRKLGASPRTGQRIMRQLTSQDMA